MKGKKNKVKMIDSDNETNGKEKNIGKKKKKICRICGEKEET